MKKTTLFLAILCICSACTESERPAAQAKHALNSAQQAADQTAQQAQEMADRAAEMANQ